MSSGRGRPLRGAIAGFGNAAAKAHLPAWQHAGGYNILAVADTSKERLEAASESLPQARLYDSVGDLLAAEKLDFLDIATPPASHADIITKAAQHKVHVLCEKPLALSNEESRNIEAAAAGGKIAIYTVDNWKFAPLLRTVRRLLTRGEIGRVRSTELQILRHTPPGGAVAQEAGWRLDPRLAGGGIAVDHGWHAFYLLLHFIGKPPLSVRAKLERRKFFDREVEDTAEIEVEFQGAAGRLFLTWAADRRANTGRVVGEQGEIEIADDRLILCIPRREKVAYTFSEPLSAASYHPQWFESMLDDFRKEVRDPLLRGTNLREALTCVALVLATYRSHQCGGAAVPVSEPVVEEPSGGTGPGGEVPSATG